MLTRADPQRKKLAAFKDLNITGNVKQRNWVFATLFYFLITLSLHTFQTMNSISSNKLSLKYQIFTPSHCKDIGIRQFVFVAKTQIFTQLPMKPSKLLKVIYRFKYSSLSNTKNFFGILSLKPTVYYRLPFLECTMK